MSTAQDKVVEEALEELRRVLKTLLGRDVADVLVLGIRYENFDHDKPVLAVGISPEVSNGRYAQIPKRIDGIPVQKFRTPGPVLGG